MSAWSKFSDWLSERLTERKVSMREASLSAGLDHGAISRFMQGTRPSVENCQKLAHYFGVPEKQVLEVADYFPPESHDEFVREITYLAGQVPVETRETVLDLLRRAIERERQKPPETEGKGSG